ncbi:DUF6449 domain-containing protein [Faecalimonas sp.]
MMSKISYFKLIKEDIKKRAWLLLLSITIFVVIIPILSAIKIEGALPGGVSSSYANWKEVKNWFVMEMGFFNKYLWFSIIVGGILSGITSFSYLYSKRQIDFYHSLPIKRETWYFVNCISGIIQIVVPYIIGYIFMLIIGAMKGVASQKLFQQSGSVMGVTILIFLLIYGITVLVIILTGKLLVGVLGIIIFLTWGSVIVALKNYIMLQIFDNYMVEESISGFVDNMIGRGAWYSPILISRKIEEYNQLGKPMFPIIITMIIMIILIFTVGLLAFKNRRLENAGKAVAFSKVESIVQSIITITAGMFFAVIVSSQNQVKGMKIGWMYGIAIISVVIVYGIISFIYYGDIKMIFQRKTLFSICVGVTLIFLTIIRFDVFKYDKYIPNREKIESMSIDSYDANYLLDYRSRWKGENYKQNLEKLKITDFNEIYSLIEETLRKNEKNDEEKSVINVGYYLKNGRKIYRSYHVDRKKLFRCMDRMMLEEGYKREVLKGGEIEASKINTINFENIRAENISIKLNEKEKELLLETYYKDMEKYPLSEVFDGEIVGKLYCTGKGTEYMLYVFEEYKSVISNLKKYCDVPGKILQSEVQYITVEDYRKPHKMRNIIIQSEDKEKIQKLLGCLTYTEIGIFNTEVEPNINVTISTDRGSISALIKKNKVPDFLNK